MFFPDLNPIADSGLPASSTRRPTVLVPETCGGASPAVSDAYATGSPLDTPVLAPGSPRPLVVAADIFPPEDTERIHDEMQKFIGSINRAVEELTRLEEATSEASVKQEIREKIESLNTIAGKLEKQISGESEKPIRSIEEWQEVKSTLLDPAMEDLHKYIEQSRAKLSELQVKSSKLQANSRQQEIDRKIQAYEDKLSRNPGARDFSEDDLMDLLSLLQEVKSSDRAESSRNAEQRIIAVLKSFQKDLKQSREDRVSRLKHLEATKGKDSAEYKKLQGVIEDLDKLIETIGDPENDSPESSLRKLETALQKDKKLSDVFLSAINGVEFIKNDDGTYEVKAPKDKQYLEDYQRKLGDWHEASIDDFGTFLKYGSEQRNRELFGDKFYIESLARYDLSLAEIQAHERDFNRWQEEQRVENEQEARVERERDEKAAAAKQEAKTETAKAEIAEKTGSEALANNQHLQNLVNSRSTIGLSDLIAAGIPKSDLEHLYKTGQLSLALALQYEFMFIEAEKQELLTARSSPIFNAELMKAAAGLKDPWIKYAATSMLS